MQQASGDTSAAAVKEEADAPISTAKEEESLGVRMLKFVGWMGGFYSRKSVSGNMVRAFGWDVGGGGASPIL